MTLQPYLKSTSIFRCPGDSNPGPSDWSPRKNGFMSFYLNSNLAGQKKSVLLFSRSTILLGDGSNGKDISDATYSKSSLPPEWIADPNSPAWRHLNGANYLMADGSVHWLRPNEVTTFGGRKNAFAIR